MFNGIILNTGKIVSIKKSKNSALITVKSNLNFTTKDLGSSVSCNGVCLTISKIKKKIDFFLLVY